MSVCCVCFCHVLCLRVSVVLSCVLCVCVVVVEHYCILTSIIVVQPLPRNSSPVYAKRLFFTKTIVSCTRNDECHDGFFVVVTSGGGLQNADLRVIYNTW